VRNFKGKKWFSEARPANGQLTCTFTFLKRRHYVFDIGRYVPWDVYADKNYPPYCYGGGYILSGDLVELLLESAKKLTYYWIDDVFVTGFAAKKVPGGVRHIQLPKQNPIRSYTCPPACMKKNQRWFMHTLQKVEMLQSYFRVLQNEGLLLDHVSAAKCTAPASVPAQRRKKQ
jgi:Galactosyltransferase